MTDILTQTEINQLLKALPLPEAIKHHDQKFWCKIRGFKRHYWVDKNGSAWIGDKCKSCYHIDNIKRDWL